jgi:uncharacterized glyoxalase superfamily protein PhnB
MQAPEGSRTSSSACTISDGRAALAFLERAFRFQDTFEVPAPDGGILQRRCGWATAPIMIDSGPRDLSAWGDNVQAIHVYLADPMRTTRGPCRQARRSRTPPFDTPWARGYYTRDLDGFLWGFSNYKPQPSSASASNLQPFFS